MSVFDLTEAIQVAAYSDGVFQAKTIREAIDAAVRVAAPFIEAAVRETVAADIEAGIPLAEKRRQDWITRNEPDQALKYKVAILTLEQTARIARGSAS